MCYHSPRDAPSKGQCYGWAVKQTGFDHANPRVATPASPPSYSGQAPAQQGGLFRGAAGGAIGGNAGEGAAVGAGVGVLFGGLRRMRFEEQEQQEQQMQMRQQQAHAAEQQTALAQGRANYERAFGACMSGRGDSVR